MKYCLVQIGNTVRTSKALVEVLNLGLSLGYRPIHVLALQGFSYSVIYRVNESRLDEFQKMDDIDGAEFVGPNWEATTE